MRFLIGKLGYESQLANSHFLASQEDKIFGLLNLLLLQITTEERSHPTLIKEQRWLSFYQGNEQPYQEHFENKLEKKDQNPSIKYEGAGSCLRGQVRV